MISKPVFVRWLDGVNQIAALVCHVLLCVICAVTVAQVFLRFVLNSPTSWSEEVALLSLIWFGLLAVAVGVRRHEHVAITFLRDLLPAPLALMLDYLAQISMAIFMFVVMFYSRDLIALAGVQVLPASGMPKSLLYLPASIGGALGLLNALANIALRSLNPEPAAMGDIDGR